MGTQAINKSTVVKAQVVNTHQPQQVKKQNNAITSNAQSKFVSTPMKNAIACTGPSCIVSIVTRNIVAAPRTVSVRELQKHISALQDSNWRAREAAAAALGEIKDKRAVPALIKALQDSDSDVRKAAVEGLGKIRDKRAVPALIKALQDSDSDVRKAVANALLAIGDRRAIPSLAKHSGDIGSKIFAMASKSSKGRFARAVYAKKMSIADGDTLCGELSNLHPYAFGVKTWNTATGRYARLFYNRYIGSSKLSAAARQLLGAELSKMVGPSNGNKGVLRVALNRVIALYNQRTHYAQRVLIPMMRQRKFFKLKKTLFFIQKHWPKAEYDINLKAVMTYARKNNGPWRILGLTPAD